MRSQNQRAEERVVEEAILSYLADHPQAMDTEQGIAEWWLMRQQVKVNAQLVKSALQHLLEERSLEKIGTNEHARYRLKS